MSWLRHNWLGVVIVAGIILSLFIIQTDNRTRDRADALKSVAGCQRGAEQKALDASAWIRAAQARRADGNKEAANYYEGIADGMILTIAAPTQALRGTRAMAHVSKVFTHGRLRYVVTPQTKRFQRAGCEKAYLA